MDIGEMDLMDVWNHPSDILLFMSEKLFISEKKDVIAEDTESHLGVVEFMFICIVLPTVGNLTFIS